MPLTATPARATLAWDVERPLDPAVRHWLRTRLDAHLPGEDPGPHRLSHDCIVAVALERPGAFSLHLAWHAPAPGLPATTTEWAVGQVTAAIQALTGAAPGPGRQMPA